MNSDDQLNNNETTLIGSWLSDNDNVVADEICERIQRLINSHLKKITMDKSGWETLYQDPIDKRYWVLTYPNSDWHGGGPPSLKTVSLEEAQTKFSID